MPDALPQPASVAVVPCYNEGRNPIDLCASLQSVPGLAVALLDDGSEGESRAVLDQLEKRDARRVTVKRNAQRSGKVTSLLNAMRGLDASVRKVLLIDCDVEVPAATAEAVLDELDRSDLVLVNAQAFQNARTTWERGSIFSANRHDRVRNALIERYPALCTNGRLLGMSRRLVDAIVASDVPRHTEDAHFMLVCLTHGFPYAYLHDAQVRYRAPDTLEDYLRQSNRFSEGRALLQERWPEDVLRRYYDPQGRDLVVTALEQALRDPVGAAVFAVMLVAKSLQGRARRSQGATWAVAQSTKALR